jgi:methionine-rich copper-binding protein CopC
MRKLALRALFASLFALVLGASLTGLPVAAHADVASSNPEADSTVAVAPASVEVVFSTEVEEGTTLEVFGPDGAPVHSGAAVIDLNDPDRTRVTVALNADLAPGVYVVNWVSASTDGHTEEGSFTFTIGGDAAASPEASPQASPGAVAATEDEIKAQMHEIADRAQQQATIEAASEDPLDEGDFALAVLAGIAAAIVIYIFWRKVRPSAEERVRA